MKTVELMQDRRIKGLAVVLVLVVGLVVFWQEGIIFWLQFEDTSKWPKTEMMNGMFPKPSEWHTEKQLPVLPFDIDWPASSTIDSNILAKLSQENREAVKKSAAPVLLPSKPEITASTSLYSGVGGYYLAIEYPDIPIIEHVFATAEGGGKAPSTPSPYMPDRVRGLPADIGETEGGRYVTWNEFGAAYYLEIRCFRVPNDPRCTSDEYLRSIVENLHYVGGKGE